MANHPNPSTRAKGLGHNPGSEEIRAAREAAGLTQTEAAHLIYCALNSWQQWEAGTRRMHAAFWELFSLKCKRL
jgi:putative transcriptional regulator